MGQPRSQGGPGRAARALPVLTDSPAEKLHSEPGIETGIPGEETTGTGVIALVLAPRLWTYKSVLCALVSCVGFGPAEQREGHQGHLGLGSGGPQARWGHPLSRGGWSELGLVAPLMPHVPTRWIFHYERSVFAPL